MPNQWSANGDNLWLARIAAVGEARRLQGRRLRHNAVRRAKTPELERFRVLKLYEIHSRQPTTPARGEPAMPSDECASRTVSETRRAGARLHEKRKLYGEMVGRVGLEPTTNGLRVHCSTN